MPSSQVVLITGGSSGIGLETARILLRNPEMHSVAICGRNLQRLESAVADLAPPSDRFHAVQADVSQAEDVGRLVDSVLRRFGRIDAVVNSAGLGHLGPFVEATIENMERLWRVNVLGTQLVTLAVLPHMIEQKNGLIVNLAGILGLKTIANAALYCATKHAVVGFGNALAQELKRHNVRVTSICCSGVDTPFWEGIPGKPRPELLLKPQEVALEVCRTILMPPHLIANTVVLQHTAHQL